MSEWIEIPAHRVLKIDYNELKADFEALGEDGEILNWQNHPTAPTCYRRKRDGKLFRPPRFHAPFADFACVVYLEEK